MKSRDYPEWVDEYAVSSHHAFKNMVPYTWGPIDGLGFFSILNGTFIDKVHEAIKSVKAKECSMKEIANSFSCPSTLRVALFFLSLEYQGSHPKDKDKFREVVEFFVDVLKYMNKEDIFVYEKNVSHDKEEIEKILKTIPWIKADAKITRELGKLYNSLASLAFALYNDFFPQEAHEIYGPYNAESKFGKGTILLIKHFPKIQPKEIWPKIKSSPYKEVKIFQVMKDVKFSCDIIGMHSMYKGDIINNTVAVAVMINGEFIKLDKIKSVSEDIARIATEQSKVYEEFSTEEFKKKFLEWSCYQFFGFFKLAGMDWHPTEEMIQAIKGKKIKKRSVLKEFPDYKEFTTSKEFEVYWLKDLYKC